MTTDPPPPGSPWAARCPDAYPMAWYRGLGLSALPAGFARLADPDEEEFITGPTGSAGRQGRTVPARPASAPPAGRPRRGSPTGGRFELLNGFIDFDMGALTRGEVVVWMVLYRDARDGSSRTGQADVARRAGMSVRGVQKVIHKLEAKGLVAVVRRGGLGRGPSTYRVGTPPGGPRSR